MSPAVDLVSRLLRAREVPADLVADLDPFTVAELALALLGEPASAAAAAALRQPVQVTVGGPNRSTEPGPDQVPAAVFVRAVAAEDLRAVDLAAGVDVAAVGYLALIMAAQPAYRDRIAWLDRYVLEVDRPLVLGDL